MAGMVMQHRNGIEFLAEFWHRCIIDLMKSGPFCKATGIKLQVNRTGSGSVYDKRGVIAF